MKLTAVQQKILDLMDDGWELGESMGLNPNAWIQQGGLGRGGKAQEVRLSTLFGLEQKGLIKVVEEIFPLRRFRRLK